MDNEKQTATLISEEEVQVQNLHEDEFFDIKINNELLIHVKRNDTGYSVDVYRDNNDPELMEDSGFLNSLTVWDDDLTTENDLEEPEE